MASSLKPFVVKFWDVRSVHRVRKVKARNAREAERKVARKAFGSFGHYAQIDPALKHLYMEAS